MIDFSKNKLSIANSEQLIKELFTCHNSMTRFNFLNDHYGLRPGKMHVLLAASGKGKSTVARSILMDHAKNQKVLLYATEETGKDVETQLSQNSVNPQHLMNIHFMHERVDMDMATLEHADINEWFRILEAHLDHCKAKVLILDNITSSMMYSDAETQKRMILRLKQLLEDKQVAALIVCHTKKGVKNSDWFKEDDVKGSTQISITAEFFYGYNMFVVPSKGTTEAKHAFIRVLKSRSYPNVAFSYDLDFDFKLVDYKGDTRVKTSDLEEIAKKSSKIL